MKKIAVLTLFFLFVTFQSLIGQYQYRDLKIGLQLSPGLHWMGSQSNQINGTKSKVGVQAGLYGEWYFRAQYALTTGIGFAFGTGGTLQHEQAGSYWRLSDLPGVYNEMPAEVKLRYSIQYLEIPFGIKLNTPQIGYWNYYLAPALVFNFRTQAKGKIVGAGLPESTETFYIKKEINGAALAYRLGAGAAYQLNQQMSLTFGLYYQKSFTDITNDTGIVFDQSRGWPNTEPLENSTDQQHSIVWCLGILF